MSLFWQILFISYFLISLLLLEKKSSYNRALAPAGGTLVEVYGGISSLWWLTLYQMIKF